jgi:protein TonB
MTFEFSGSDVIYTFLGLVLITAGVIFVMRRFLSHIASSNLTEKHALTKWKSPLQARTKYPEVNTFQFSGTFLNYGLLAAIVLMILAFSWTTFEKKVDLTLLLGTTTDEIEMETPRTAEPPPPPPPPPPPSAIAVVPTDLPILETITFKDQSIDEETSIEAPAYAPTKEIAPPPPPPPVIEENEREIFKVVEENPTFPGCENVEDKVERKQCAEEKMLTFIYNNIQYPVVARENGIAGMVVVQFVVERDGSISNIKLVRDIGGGCGQEAMRVVSLMPKWNPGKQRMKPVRVQFTLPVKFILN